MMVGPTVALGPVPQFLANTSKWILPLWEQKKEREGDGEKG